jgi:hypothetical protein
VRLARLDRKPPIPVALSGLPATTQSAATTRRPQDHL